MKMKIDRKRDVERIIGLPSTSGPTGKLIIRQLLCPYARDRALASSSSGRKGDTLASLRVFIGYGVTRKLADIRAPGE